MEENMPACQIISAHDEDGAHWPSLEQWMGERIGYIAYDSVDYCRILYLPEGISISVPKVCVKLCEE